MKYQLPDDQIKYYNNTLLIEVKVFCQSMLGILGIGLERYKNILLNNNIEALFAMIKTHEITFFKKLIVYDMTRFKLIKGHIINDVYQAQNSNEILLALKKYAILTKLVNALTDEFNLLYGH